MIRTGMTALGIAALLLQGGVAFAEPLSPTRVQINPQGVATRYSVETTVETPYDNSMPPGPVGLPSHTVIRLEDSEPILIIPIADYRTQWNAAGDQTVANRIPQITAIARQQAPIPATNMPILPPPGAYNDLVTLGKPVNFSGGNGVRVVARFAQDPSPVQPFQLHYIYQGVTTDGNYLVSFDLPLQVNWTQEIPIEDAARIIGTKASTDFTPSLDQVDTMMASLQIISPAQPPASGPQATTGTTPADLDLEGPVWQWTKATMGGTTFVTPREPSRYTIQFKSDGVAAIRADCNLASAPYTDTGSRFALGDIVSTRVACPPDSLESQFLGLLAETDGYYIDGRELKVHIAAGLRIIEMHFSPVR